MSKEEKKVKQENNGENKIKSDKSKLKNAENKIDKPKKDYKMELEKEKQRSKELEKKLEQQIIENENNIKIFQEKAKEFSKKAQEEVDKIKMQLNEKLNKEKEEFKKYSSQDLIESIIEPILNIEIAIKSGKNNDAVKAYVVGFEMLVNQLYDQMESFNITKINPKLGDEFDPAIHYALEAGKGTKILSVKKAGFKLHERVIKPATVIIG